MLRHLLLSYLLAGPAVASSSKRSTPLKFRRDGTFQLSIFEDLHFGENAWEDWGPQQDVKSIQVIEDVLDYDTPDLVVLNGDLITGENTYVENSTDYVDIIVKPLLDRGLRWASTYGNHDYQVNITGKNILQRERKWSNALTRQMVFDRDAGVSNYYLPVFPSNCADSTKCIPELLLWFFDSRGGSYYQQWDENGSEIGQPNWVDRSVVNWFRKTNKKLVAKHRKVIPSLAFVHIPTYASLMLQTQSGVDGKRQPGINDDYPLSPQAQGWCADGRSDGSCSYGGQDTAFMRAITETAGLMALFSGHDHGDTWCYKWDGLVPGLAVEGNGINMCFGQHSGYGGYGSWIRGARQVLISRSKIKNLAVDTWIRLESGNKVGSVSLNSTYNLDEYPETPNDKTSLD
ncbi:Metallo-dependent phosphatase-like protein [Dactylonectria estremocensis]|uniref:Metallo-dependent phosphatase-like protein n=1 Tax=Dactylonectria estremocensis TaxID=1079267 RepID=A0A9P9FD17_9HYPO|nr:Metallo-dependent phosphatase-like protein [Dactylonectria estremocensis]